MSSKQLMSQIEQFAAMAWAAKRAGRRELAARCDAEVARLNRIRFA
jgi:hypothetical protein